MNVGRPIADADVYVKVKTIGAVLVVPLFVHANLVAGTVARDGTNRFTVRAFLACIKLKRYIIITQ